MILTINLIRPALTREAVEAIVREHLPELKDVEFSVSRNHSGEWHWATGENNESFEHDWSGFVHADGRFEGPY